MPIIVASNNVFRRELSSYILSEAGYTVYEAHNDAVLLSYLDHVQPALVLFDIVLAEANNFDLIYQIRQLRSVPILFIAKEAMLTKAHALVDNKADYVLSWPYQAEDLLARVRVLHNSARPGMNAVGMTYNPSLSNGADKWYSTCSSLD